MYHTCQFCGEDFIPKATEVKYCSNSCRQLDELRIKLFTSQQAPPLKVIKGDLFNTIKRVRRTEHFWIFCHSLLWGARNFTQEQQHEYKVLIAEHFRNTEDIDATFKMLIESAVVAKRLFIFKHREVQAPQLWLNANYFYGLIEAIKQYDRIEIQRKSLPNYEMGLTILSEAVADYFDKRNMLDIYGYREQFIKLGQADLLQFYLNAVMHIQFINL
jgi:hypothetical protein